MANLMSSSLERIKDDHNSLERIKVRIIMAKILSADLRLRVDI